MSYRVEADESAFVAQIESSEITDVDALCADIRSAQQKRIVLNFQSVTQMTCAVMHKLKDLAIELGQRSKRIRVCGMSEWISFRLRFDGVEQLCDVFESVADALILPSPMVAEEAN